MAVWAKTGERGVHIGSAEWTLLPALAAFSLVNYVLRTNISVAAQFMMPELRLSQADMGQVFSAFMLAYAIFQTPAGVAGDRFGPRKVLTIAALAWFATTLLTGALPGLGLASAGGAFLSLLTTRFVLGAAEAATYPVATRAIASWIPFERRAFANGVLTAGMAVGSACTPPIIAWLMVRRGWRECFYLTSALPLLLAAAWWKYSGGLERRFPTTAPAASPVQPGASWWTLLKNHDMALLSISYFLESYIQYIFLLWFFLYLVDVRGFTIVNGGFATSLPYVVAMASMPLAGYSSDWLAARYGRGRGRRAVTLTGFCAAAALLLFGADSTTAYIAVASISLSVGLVLSTEGPFWSTATDIAGPHAGAAGGIMNTAGNLAGVASSSLVPVLVREFGWTGVFLSSAALCVLAGALWLLIRFPEARPAIEEQSELEGDLSW